MKTYVWTINGAAYPNRNSLDVRIGERVEIDLSNGTSMAHPMHLHGHDFEVLKIDNEKISGALRDTVVVPPGSKITVGFDTDNAGIWAFHCHLIYHLATGMFTVLRYEGADVQFWQPEKQASELKNQLEPSRRQSLSSSSHLGCSALRGAEPIMLTESEISSETLSRNSPGRIRKSLRRILKLDRTTRRSP